MPNQVDAHELERARGFDRAVRAARACRGFSSSLARVAVSDPGVDVVLDLGPPEAAFAASQHAQSAVMGVIAMGPAEDITAALRWHNECLLIAPQVQERVIGIERETARVQDAQPVLGYVGQVELVARLQKVHDRP